MRTATSAGAALGRNTPRAARLASETPSECTCQRATPAPMRAVSLTPIAERAGTVPVSCENAPSARAKLSYERQTSKRALGPLRPQWPTERRPPCLPRSRALVPTLAAAQIPAERDLPAPLKKCILKPARSPHVAAQADENGAARQE